MRNNPPTRHNPKPTPNQPEAWHSGRKLFGLLFLVLLVPVLPFLLAGPYLESLIEQAIRLLQIPSAIFLATIGALAVDIFLPVPSSAVITFAGARCGVVGGTLAGFLGLSLGCGIGYELSRWLGPRLLARYSSASDTAMIQALAERWGALGTILSRPLPILGETAVLVLGCLEMDRRIFYLAAGGANLVIAMVYAASGRFGEASGLLPWILAASLFVPVLSTCQARRILRQGMWPLDEIQIQPFAKQEFEANGQKCDAAHDGHAEHRPECDH